MKNGRIIEIIIVFSKTCNGGADSNCLSCEPLNNRTYHNIDHTCPCDDGFYDKGIGKCDDCHYSWFSLLLNKYL